MSYKDYSVEAVKEIMTKVRNSQITDHNSGSHEYSLVDSKHVYMKNGLSSRKSQKKIDYEYNRPTTAESNRITETHIFIEKWFECELSEDYMWNEIQTKLDHHFTDKDTAGKVKEGRSKKKWIYKNHSNHEMIFTLKKTDRFANLKISNRVGFWGAHFDGILHGSYTSLILLGLIYAIYQPTLQLSIGIFFLLWIVNAFAIYKFSISSRKKKHARLSNFTDKLVESFILYDKEHHLSNTGTESNSN